MTRKIQWRCFHCGDTFTLAQRKWAAEHFGGDLGAEPVCMIRSAAESALLSALRVAEQELSSYRVEDTRIMRAMWAMQADHRQALIQEEQRGYDKGVADAREEQRAMEAGE